eukprot:Colp12_sorted_trinity150504_noHs@29412
MLSNQMIAKRILNVAGYDVHIARDGLEGVECFKTGVFDLVLMDLNMPVMDGLEATRRIREIEAERVRETGEHERIPIIALTAMDSSASRQECKQAGMDCFLPKSVMATSLVVTIQKWL